MSRDPRPAGRADRWSDRRLIRACLKGDQEAWNQVVDRHSRLVFGICRRYAADRDEAADLFQQVWMEVLADLSGLRRQTALRSWIASVAAHRCFRWRQKTRRRQALAPMTPLEDEDGRLDDPAVPSLEELEREQLVREALAELPHRCREMLRLLFYAEPAARYAEVAERLGLAEGSIGLTRRRCLSRLQKLLEKRGIG